MISLTRVKLTAFGCFRDVEYTLQPGFNLIYGSNEAGKSTFAAAIAGVIFGLRRERERFIPWGSSGRCEAEVTFTYADRKMIIARDFISDTVRAVERSPTATVWRFEGKVSPVGRSSEREEYLAKIEEIWGFSEGDIFRNSVYVKQQDIPIKGEGNLNGRIQQLLSGFAGMDYDAVVVELEKELYRITKKPGGRARNRELEEVRIRIAEQEALLCEAGGMRATMESLETATAERAAWLDNARSDLERGRHYLDRIRTYYELSARKKVLESDFERVEGELGKVNRFLDRKQKLEALLGDLAVTESLPDDFPLILQSHREAKQKLSILETDASDSAHDTVDHKLRVEWQVLLLILWIATAFCAISYRNTHIAVFMMMLAISFLASVGVLLHSQAQKLAASRRLGQLEEMNNEMALLRKVIDSGENRFPVLGTVGDGDNGIVRDILRAKRLREELSLGDAALGVLSEHAHLVAQARELTRGLAVVEERLEQVAGKGFPLLSEEEFAAAEMKVRQLETDVAGKERTLRESEQELAVLSRTSLDFCAIEDELEELRTREILLSGRSAALQLAVDVLQEAMNEYRSTYLSRFAREVSGQVQSFTSGHYREAVFDEDLNLSLDAEGGFRPVEAMSCGVQDQAYIGARLTLGKILSRGKKLPFLLDDPLVNFDEERRRGALKSFDAISREHQILLFVHDSRYASLKGSGSWHKILLRNRRVEDGQLSLL